MSVILSGIQASGTLHLGNYLGSVLQWKNKINQNQKNNVNDKFFFMIADLHSLTTVKNKDLLKNNVINLISSYLGCGIGIDDNNVINENVTIFIQSQVRQHTELTWILSCITPIGQLFRMTQFKDKFSKYSNNNEINNSNANAGLLFYPILMASDILLYKTNKVPVGDDQRQHIEFTRDIAEKFNSHYDSNVFNIPEIEIQKETARIMSLQDGTKKMSKSDESVNAIIYLTDTDDIIAKKIKIAKTDSFTGIYYDKQNRPEVSNLIEIFALLLNSNIKNIENKYQNIGTKQFKDDLTDCLINTLSPIRNKINQFQLNPEYLLNIVKNGNNNARNVGEETMKNVRNVVGI